MALPTQQTCPERDATLQGAGFDTDQGFASPLAPHSVCTAVTEGTRRHFEGHCNVEHPSDLRLQHMVDAPGQKLTQSGTGTRTASTVDRTRYGVGCTIATRVAEQSSFALAGKTLRLATR